MSPSQYAFDACPPLFPSLTNESHPIFLPPNFIYTIPVPISTTQEANLKANLRPALQLATHLLLSPASLLFLSRILNPHLSSSAEQNLPALPFTSQTASFVQDSLSRLASEDRIHIRFLPPTSPSPPHSPASLSPTNTPRSTSRTPHPPSYAHTQPRDFLPNGHPDYTRCVIYLHANIHRAFLRPSHTHHNPLNTTTTKSPSQPLSALFLAILLCHELIHAIHMVTRSSPPNQASSTVVAPLTTNQSILPLSSHHPPFQAPTPPPQTPTPPHTHVAPSQPLPSTLSLPSPCPSFPPTEPFWSRSRPEFHHRCLTTRHQPSSSTLQAATAELGLAWELLVFGNARIEPRAGAAGVDGEGGLVVGRIARKRAAGSRLRYEGDVDDERGGYPTKKQKMQKEQVQMQQMQKTKEKQEREERRERFIEYAELPVQWARELFLDETWDVIDRGGLWGLRGREGEWVGRGRNWGVDGSEILWVPRGGRAIGR